jgi:hypothetical protein
MPSVEANCNTLCDCVIDVCGNVLRILEHSQCSPGCEGLSKAQIECRLAECLQGGSEGRSRLELRARRRQRDRAAGGVPVTA